MRLVVSASQPYRRESGSALIVCLMIGGIVGIMVGSMLSLVSYQSKETFRSQAWNEALVLAEAGMEEGLSLVNRYANSGSPLAGWRTIAATDGWSEPVAGTYTLTRSVGSSRYRVIISFSGADPAILSTGYAYFAPEKRYLSRSISVSTSSGSLFLGALLAKGRVDINGSAVIDSYDPRDPARSTNGAWDPHKRGQNGNVGSIASKISGVIKLNGAANVYGMLGTGPDSTASISGSSSAGSLAWVDGGSKGLQAGWLRNDLNSEIPDAPALPPGAYEAFPSGSTIVLNASGKTNFYRSNNNISLNSKATVIVTNGTVIIDARAGVKLNAQASIQISPNSRLILFLGTENTQLNGTGMVNASGSATNCIIYGTPQCKQLEINGSAQFVGYVYAPYADITLNGNSDSSGAFVGASFQINGNMGLHYDESLSGPQSAGTLYRVASWQEVSNPAL